MNELVVELLTRLGWASAFLAGACVLTYVVLRLLRVRTSNVHEWAWWVVLLHGLLLFQVTLSVPWYEPSASIALGGEGPVLSASVETTTDAVAEPAVEAPSPVVKPGPVVPVAEQAVIFSWAVLIGAAWLGGMVLILMRWSWDYVSFVRSCRSRPCDRRDWTEEWNSLLREARIEKPIPIHLGFGVGPALCRHWTGYRLIVPVRLWRQLSSEQRRCVMQHELAHYRRGDVWRLLVARLLALPHWFNPFAWYAVGAIELVSEYACDDYASQAEREATTDYAKTLLAIGELTHRAPAWTTAGGGGCLFKRITRVLSVSQTKESVMKKAVVLVVVVSMTLVSAVRIELVAQERSRPDSESELVKRDSSPAVTQAVAEIRRLAKPAIPFEEIEAIANQAAGSDNAGPIYAEVATAHHKHGSPPRTIAWAQAALRQPLGSLERLRMFQYWAEAAARLPNAKEVDDHFWPIQSVTRPAVWGLIEASRYRIPVEGFRAARVPSPRTDANWIREYGDELVDVRDALVRVIARDSSNSLAAELKRFFLSEGFLEGAEGGEETPRWLGEGRAMACTFLIDYPQLWKDLTPVMDAYIGEPGAFDDVKEGIRVDKHGPQVDLDEELIPYLGQRTTVVTDYREPSLGQGEQFLYAVEVTDSKQVTGVCDRLCEADNDICQVTQDGVTIWVSEPREGRPTQQGTCVAHGYLLSGDFDLLLDTLERWSE